MVCCKKILLLIFLSFIFKLGRYRLKFCFDNYINLSMEHIIIYSIRLKLNNIQKLNFYFLKITTSEGLTLYNQKNLRYFESTG